MVQPAAYCCSLRHLMSNSNPSHCRNLPWFSLDCSTAHRHRNRFSTHSCSSEAETSFFRYKATHCSSESMPSTSDRAHSFSPLRGSASSRMESTSEAYSLFAPKVLPAQRRSRKDSMCVLSQMETADRGLISTRFSMIDRELCTPCSSSSLSWSRRDRFCTTSSTPCRAVKACTKVMAASNCSDTASASVISWIRLTMAILMSVFSCASRPRMESTAPASTSMGYSSGEAATAKRFSTSACSSISLSMNFSASSAYFMRIFWFFVIFFSRLSSSCFRLVASSCSMPLASASSNILSMPFALDAAPSLSDASSFSAPLLRFRSSTSSPSSAFPLAAWTRSK
mmetsp:Transcript_18665/g.42262  ORF Transcript_18665/g.42262 Transcript_18665/m.42262 type:complete len:340 (+) Transcript_18665:792-1811(+)